MDKKYLNFFLIFFLSALSIFVFSSCSNKSLSYKKPLIVTTIFPLTRWIENITDANVYQIVKNGIDPHEYDLSYEDMEKIEKASYVVAIGKGLEPFYNKLPKNKTILLKNYVSNNENPHIWLSPKRALKSLEILKEKMPNLIDQKKYNSYYKKFQKLDRDYEIELSKIKNRAFIMLHPSYYYLAKDYGLNIVYSPGNDVSEEWEPSLKDYLHIINIIKKDKVHAILADMENPKLALKLGKETGVKVIILNDMHSLIKGSYINLMYQNLNELVGKDGDK